MAGQIIDRGHRKWLVRVYLGRDPETGKRKYKSWTVRGAKKDAQRSLNKALRELDTGVFVEPSREALSSYLKRWLEASVKPRVRPRTHHDYKAIARRYLVPALGTRPLSQITPLEVQKLYADMQAKGLSARTVRYAHAVLRSALDQAVKWRLLAQNPTTLVTLPRQKRKEVQVLTREQANLFLKAAADDRWHALWVVLLTTGLRPGEALALRWADVDGDRLHVQRTLVRRAGIGHAFEEPKTSRGRRSVTLPSSAVDVLQLHRKRQLEERMKAGPEYENQDLIFATLTGGPMNHANIVNQYFKPLLERAGLPNIRLYDLRHTCATLLLLAGENPKVVSERLGHSTITLTMDTYSHVLPDMQQGAADRLEDLLFA